MNIRNDEGPLLELLRPEQLSPRQKALRPAPFLEDLPMYKLLREPTSLDEFDWKKLGGTALWRENGSVILICHERFNPFWDRFAYVALDHVDSHHPRCAIYGETDAAIAETLTFLCSLEHHQADAETKGEPTFNFASLQGYQLAEMACRGTCRN